MGRSSVARSGSRYCSVVLMFLWPIIACTVRKSAPFRSSAPRSMSVARVWRSEPSIDSAKAQGWRGRLDAGTTWVQGVLQRGSANQDPIDFDAAMAVSSKEMRAFYSNYERGLTTEKGALGRDVELATGRMGLVYTDVNSPLQTMIHELGQMDSTPKIGCNVYIFSYVIGNV